MPLLVRFSNTPTATNSTSGTCQIAIATKKPLPRPIAVSMSLPFLSACWATTSRRMALRTDSILRSRKRTNSASLAIALSGLRLLSASTSKVASSRARWVCRRPALRDTRTRKCSASTITPPIPMAARASGHDTTRATTKKPAVCTV